MIAKALEAGLVPTAPLIHPNVEYDHEYVEFGEGVVVCAGSILTVNIEVMSPTRRSTSTAQSVMTLWSERTRRSPRACTSPAT